MIKYGLPKTRAWTTVELVNVKEDKSQIDSKLHLRLLKPQKATMSLALSFQGRLCDYVLNQISTTYQDFLEKSMIARRYDLTKINLL